MEKQNIVEKAAKWIIDLNGKTINEERVKKLKKFAELSNQLDECTVDFKKDSVQIQYTFGEVRLSKEEGVFVIKADEVKDYIHKKTQGDNEKHEKQSPTHHPSFDNKEFNQINAFFSEAG